VHKDKAQADQEDWKDIDEAPDWPRSKKVNGERGMMRLDAKYDNE
jgi:hypothetical protein